MTSTCPSSLMVDWRCGFYGLQVWVLRGSFFALLKRRLGVSVEGTAGARGEGDGLAVNDRVVCERWLGLGWFGIGSIT